MKLTARRALDDLLVAEEPCLGAVFCTYAFNPAFFEEHALRALLRLRSDPQEQALAFHEEARGALQETPVAVLVDASVRQSGRRLPYDQLLVRSHVFHPKLVLALYGEQARVLIGSCNLTPGGYDENVEIFFARSLRYADPHDATVLREIDAFIARSLELAESAGSQAALVREELRRRLPAQPAEQGAREYAVLHSFDRPLLDQLLEAIPSDAKITRVGVLAPFYERDDDQAGSDDGIESFLSAVTARRQSDDLVIDIATGWGDAPVDPGATPVVPLEQELGRLWAWRWTQQEETGRRDRVGYVVPTSVGPKKVSFRSSLGAGERYDRDVVMSAVEERRMWPIATPLLHLPAQIVGHLRRKHDLRLWMHPTATLDERGRVQRRPLHAKVFLVTAKRRGHEKTWMLIGSPNASRGAMLRTVADEANGGGNVELAVLSVIDGAETLTGILPSLVLVDPEQAALTERDRIDGTPDLGAWIRDAIHDARTHDLRVEWAAEGPAPLGEWSLHYDGKLIASGRGAPQQATVVTPFELSMVTAELQLMCGDRSYDVPIRVADLAALPTSSALARLDLRELLAVLGRRVGAERIDTLITQRGPGGADGLLESIFGQGFGPIDVFRAWWGIADTLASPLSVPGFRHRLHGPLGLVRVWERLQEESGKGATSDEVWIYGCELLRALRRVALPEGAEREAKATLLRETCAAIGASVDALRPSSDKRPWLDSVARFYEVEDTHA